MTDFVGAEKPSLEELAHHGVKGMKWGHRKKYSTSDIKDARARQQSRAVEVNNAAAKLNLASKAGGKGAEKAAATYAKKANAYKSNKDAAVAARMTKGEKAVSLLIGGPIGAIVIAGNAAAVRSMEKKSSK